MANYREMSLGELLNDAERAKFLKLRQQGYITDELVPKFYNRFITELENADFTRTHRQEREVGLSGKAFRAIGTDADTIRQNAFKNSIEGLSERNRPLWRSIAADTGTLARSLAVDDEGELTTPRDTIAYESASEYVQEHGAATPLHFLKSSVETVIGGVGDVAGGRAGEYGEHALEHAAKIGSVIPVGRVAGKGLATALSRSATRGAGRALAGEGAKRAAVSDATQAVRQVVGRIASNPNISFSQAIDELAGVGVARARASEILETAVRHPAWRVPAHGTEVSDILGAREEVLIELMAEGTLEATGVGFDAATRRFQSRPPQEVIDGEVDTRGIQDASERGELEQNQEVAQEASETQAPPDPIAEKQAARAEANEVAATETAQKARGPKIAATLDAVAVQLAQMAQQVATNKEAPTNQDLVNLSDEAFVEVVESQIMPQVGDRITDLEDAGVADASNALRARMLELHQDLRADLQQPTTEQVAQTDLAGQPTQEIIDAEFRGDVETTTAREESGEPSREPTGDTVQTTEPSSNVVPDDSDEVIESTTIQQDDAEVAPPEEVATEPDVVFEQANPLTMSLDEISQSASDARTDEDAELLQALGSEERVQLFKRLSRTMGDEFDAEFGDLTPEQEQLIYGDKSDPRLSSEEWSDVQREITNITTIIEDIENNITGANGVEYALQSLTRALIQITPEDAKLALESEGTDIRTNLPQIINSLRVREIINTLRTSGLTSEDIATGAVRYLSGEQNITPDQIRELLIPWFGEVADVVEPETPAPTTEVETVPDETADTTAIDEQVLNAIGEQTSRLNVAETTGLSEAEVEASIQRLFDAEQITQPISGDDIYGRTEQSYPLEERQERLAQRLAELTVVKDRLDKVIKSELERAGFTEAEAEASFEIVKKRVPTLRKESRDQKRKEEQAEKRKQARIEKKVANAKYTKTDNAQTWWRDDDGEGMRTGLKGYIIKNTGHKDVEFYLFKDLDRDGNQTGNWVLVESQTGLSLTGGSHKTREEAVRLAFTALENVGIEKFRETIARTLEQRRADAEAQAEPEAEQTPEVEPTPEPEPTATGGGDIEVAGQSTAGDVHYDTVEDALNDADPVIQRLAENIAERIQRSNPGINADDFLDAIRSLRQGQKHPALHTGTEQDRKAYVNYETAVHAILSRYNIDDHQQGANPVFNVLWQKYRDIIGDVSELDTVDITPSETADTPNRGDISSALTTLGMSEMEWNDADAGQRSILLQERMDIELDAVDFDSDAIEPEFQTAFNTLNASLDEGTLSDVAVDSTENIERILDDMDASPTKARVRGIRDHIKKGLPLRLIGHQVRSAEEVAVLGQYVRDPQVETTWIVFRKGGRVLKIEPFTLNRTNETTTASLSAVEKRLNELEADDFVRIHNHPSAIARLSDEDISAAGEWRAHFGERMAEEVAVDSGTYAYFDFENNKAENEVALPAETVGFDTLAAPIDATLDVEGREGIREGDPLYTNPLARGAREVAYLGLNLKHRLGWSTIFTVSPDGTVAEAQEIDNPSPEQLVELGETYAQAGGEIHVMSSGKLKREVEALREISNSPGIGSIWVAGQRVSGATTSPTETITRDIGGTEQQFVKVDDTLSDPNAPESRVFKKPVVIAGVQHELVSDSQRQDLGSVYNRRGDAEHMTRAHSVMPEAEAQGVVKERLASQGVVEPPLEERDAYNAYHRRLGDEVSALIEQHKINEKESYDKIKAEGVIHTSGGLSFLSYGPFYRTHTDVGHHKFGFILDINKILDEIPGVTGTIHIRSGPNRSDLKKLSLKELKQAIRDHQKSDFLTEIEIRIPQDINVNEYLVGIIEDKQVYTKKDLPPDWFTSEMESDLAGQPRDEGILSDVVNDTPRGRNFINPKGGIYQILGIKTRQGGRMARHAFESGYGAVQEMRAKQGDPALIGDKLYADLKNMEEIYHNEFGKEDHRFDEFMNEFGRIASKRATPSIIDRMNPQQRSRRRQWRQEAGNKVWRFVEDNTEITNDPELADFANRFKEFWRELQLRGVKSMLAKVKEVKDLHDEDIFITDSKGNRVPWYPESFDGFVWDGERQVFVKGKKDYTVEEAHAQATKLYTPHYFKHHVLRQEYRKVQQQLEAMNKLVESDTPETMTGTLKRLELTKQESPEGTVSTPYRFEVTGDEYANIQDAIVGVRDYLSQRSTYFQEMLRYHDAGVRSERRGQGTDEPRIGHYGQLERARQSGDQNYERNIGLLKETRKLMWHRFAEISTIGQTHPFDGNSPRMEQAIKDIRAFRGNDREKALDAVAQSLRAGQPDSMFERLPEFARGVDTGLSIQQDWRVYEEQQETDAKGETITKRVKTDEYQELDIQRMNLPQNTLDTLEQTGFIEKNSDGQYKVVGETEADRQLTIARHFYEFYNTIARRENRIRQLFMSLGHWDSRNPLEMDEEEFFQKFNDAITIGTIGYGTSLLNIVEGLGVAQDIGTVNTVKGVNTMMNKEKRETLLQLSSAMSNTARFLTDTSIGERYFTSGWTFFSHTDKLSRAFGLAGGIENAKDLIRKYTTAQGKDKAALRRDMEYYNLNIGIIDAAVTVGDIDSQLKSAEDVIYAGDVDMAGTPAEQMTLANTLLRSGRFVSNEIFKRYDATSLPPVLLKHSPFLRLFTKYKSWMYQQNRQQAKRFKHIAQEAKEGNFRPSWNMAQGMMWLGGTYAMMNMIWASEREDKDAGERFAEGLLDAQTFGLASVVLQMALRSEGNWYRLQKDLTAQLGGPAASITAGVVAPIVTGDFIQAGEQALYRVPGVNVLKRVSGFRLPEVLEDDDDE